ncbi:MAG: hypothetical protein JHC40_15965 [Burkholderiales bacterium]|nr:hypothetical protein [Burkholderiales bacterium]
MKTDALQPNLLLRAGICILGISGLLMVISSDAATAVGRASATVVPSVELDIRPEPPPPSVSAVTAADGACSSRGAAPPKRDAPARSDKCDADVPTAAPSATVTVTRNADGSWSVSGGAGITIAVWQPSAGSINIEYN